MALNNVRKVLVIKYSAMQCQCSQRRLVFPSLRLPANRCRGLLVRILRSASPFFASRFILRCVTFASFFAFSAIYQKAIISTSVLMTNTDIKYQLHSCMSGYWIHTELICICTQVINCVMYEKWWHAAMVLSICLLSCPF